MTIGYAMLSAARLPVLGLLFLLITGLMAVFIAAFRDGRSRRLKGTMLVFLLISAAVFWLCLSVISWNNDYPGWSREPPAWLGAVYACPVRPLWAFEALLALFLLITVPDTFRYRKNHVTPDSIKQAMDLLPVGVAFGAPDGTVIFRNLVMEHLSVALTGKLLTDWRALQAACGDQAAVEGRIWQLRSRETPDSALTQLTATDITEQAGILEDLQVKNRKLKDMRLRLRLYHSQADRIITAQELLTARMAVHDQLGGMLLESRHYLSGTAPIDEALLLQSLKTTNASLLREYEEDGTAADPLAEAVVTARAIGVEVDLTGIPPAEETPRGILAAAIRECAANAVKHAEGDRLTADARRTDAGYTFALTTNGQPPSGPIRETGGLLTLRTLVENSHGTMRADCSPGFRLTISVPCPGLS